MFYRDHGAGIFPDFWSDRCFFTEYPGSKYRCAGRSGGSVDGGSECQQCPSVSGNGWNLYRRGKCPEFPADHRYTVFLFIYAGRQRIYGKGGFCDGQAAQKDRTFRKKYRTDAGRLWMYSTGSYGEQNVAFGT